MDVILDTCGIRQAGLDGSAFKALRTYLRVTRSSLLLPHVVLEELCAHREREVRDLDQELVKGFRTLKRLFPESPDQKPTLDVYQSAAALRDQLLRLAEQVKVLKNVPDDLDELVRRLTRRTPPASSSGEEARDVLIWLTALPVVLEGRVAFVSGDRAFWAGDQLRPELVADLGGKFDNLETFKTLDAFLKKFQTRKSFITKKWLDEELNSPAVFEALDRLYHGGDENPLELDFSDKGEPTGYTNLVQIVQHDVRDFFVSDADPDELYVSATVWAELEVEIEYCPRRGYSHYAHDLSSAKCECVCHEVEMQVQLDVVGQEVKSVRVSSVGRV